MLLNMGGHIETMAALVAASLEEALSRGFLVEVDHVQRGRRDRADAWRELLLDPAATQPVDVAR